MGQDEDRRGAARRRTARQAAARHDEEKGQPVEDRSGGRRPGGALVLVPPQAPPSGVGHSRPRAESRHRHLRLRGGAVGRGARARAKRGARRVRPDRGAHGAMGGPHDRASGRAGADRRQRVLVHRAARAAPVSARSLPGSRRLASLRGPRRFARGASRGRRPRGRGGRDQLARARRPGTRVPAPHRGPRQPLRVVRNAEGVRHPDPHLPREPRRRLRRPPLPLCPRHERLHRRMRCA